MLIEQTIIREAQADDAPQVCEYLAELIAEALPTLVLFERAPSIETESRHLLRSLQAPNSLFLVALCEDRIVGQLEFSGGWQRERVHGGSVAMSVHRSSRGAGVGTALLRELFSWVEDHPNISRVELEVLANNPAAQRLYERLGFNVEGRRKAAVLTGGQAVDAIMMAKLWPERLPRS